VYLPRTRDVVITSNRLESGITISRVHHTPEGAWACQELQPETLHAPLMANGGTNFKDGVLICAQGNLEAPAGLVLLTRSKEKDAKSGVETWDARPVLQHFMGRGFNSPNDVVCTRDGLVWFTDPTYGFEQGFRPAPRLPPQVYCFDPGNGTVRAVADGFGHPNGIAFSPDEKTCYITDTDWIWGDLSTDDRRASTM
jgi:gluconolactonase